MEHIIGLDVAVQRKLAIIHPFIGKTTLDTMNMGMVNMKRSKKERKGKTERTETILCTMYDV